MSNLSVVNGDQPFNKIIDDVIDVYKESDVVIGELMETICITNASISTVAAAYAVLYRMVEGDWIHRINNLEKTDTNESKEAMTLYERMQGD